MLEYQIIFFSINSYYGMSMKSTDTLSENETLEYLLDSVYDRFFEEYIESSNINDFLDNIGSLKLILRDMFRDTLGQDNETIISIYTNMVKENFRSSMPYNLHNDFFERLSKELILFAIDHNMNGDIIKKIYSYKETVINATSKGFLLEVINSDLPLIENQIRESIALTQINEHLIWLKQMIYDIKAEKSDKPVELDANRCEFGIWLESVEINKFFTQNDLDKIYEIHDRIHTIGKNIYNSLKRRDYTQILISYLILVKFSLHMVNNLNVKITEKELINQVETDPLTGLKNRMTLDPILKKMIELHSLSTQPFTIAILDIDHFKKINDTYGHIIGDHALRHVVEIIKKHSRDSDSVFRYGGEEFLLIFSYNSIQGGIYLAEKIRLAIEQTKFLYEEVELDITASIGLAEYLPRGDVQDYKVLIDNADKQLYVAKNEGRNRISYTADETRIKHLNDINEVAKLANREMFLQDISMLQEKAMLILLQLNQIKTLNEIYGSNTIDTILSKKVLQLNRVLIRDEATLYKLNLNEFAILVKKGKFFDKYLSLLEYSILLEHEDICVDNDDKYNHVVVDFTAGVSYGVSNIFHMADLALQEAILENKPLQIYRNTSVRKSVQEESFKRLKTYKDALHDDRIIPYFQPIVDAKSGEVLKYEALARIITENGEIISPYHFLKSAKEDKSFEYFTRQVLQKIFNIYAKNSINVSINLTYENIKSESMVKYILNRLEKFGGKGVTFEIVESEDIQDYQVVEAFIMVVKNYGCEVSIDDFGSGYSNFTNIIKFNIDYIKLDGTLIEKLLTDNNVKHMVKSLVLFAKDTNIKTIAEFVSSQELAEVVKDLDIDYAQGYYYSEPKSANDFNFKS